MGYLFDCSLNGPEGVMGSLARKWLEEGKAEGEIIVRKETALSMKKKGLDIKLISEVTKLTVEEINNLKDEKSEG